MRTLARAYVRAVEWLCEVLGHPGACWLCWNGPLRGLYARCYDIGWPVAPRYVARLVEVIHPAKRTGPGTYSSAPVYVYELTLPAP
jgi:hypothetical protein